MMDPFVNSWVGYQYSKSVIIAQILILGFIHGFFSYPTGILLVAQKNLKMLYLSSAILPIIFWAGIIFTVQYWELTSFALFKFLALTANGILYFFIALQFLDISVWDFGKKILGPMVIPLAFLILVLPYLHQFMPIEKGVINLLIVIATGGLVSAGALLLYYLFSGHFRNYTQSLLKKCFA